jgi:hypothetical protein
LRNWRSSAGKIDLLLEEMLSVRAMSSRKG